MSTPRPCPRFPLQTVIVTALAVLGAGGASAAAPPAGASTPTCEGRPASLVGTPGKRLLGTSGPDVVVTGGARNIYTYGGDDLVCVTGNPEGRVVMALGKGDDQAYVDPGSAAGEPGAHLSINDGPGADRFVGADESDLVDTDGGADDVRTGGGHDHLQLLPGRDDDVTADLGEGADTIEITQTGGTQVGALPGTHLDGGPGSDQLVLDSVDDDRRGAHWTIDNLTGRADVDGTTVVQWSDVERFAVPRLNTPLLTFDGSAADEVLDTSRMVEGGQHVVAADLGGGDDTVRTEPYATDTLDGGAGRNLLELTGYRELSGSERAGSVLAVDLAAGTMRFTPPQGAAVASTLTGFTDIRASSVERVGLTGDPQDDDLAVTDVCRATMSGASGDDVLLAEVSDSCPGAVSATLSGGPGDDVLGGTSGDDHLVGGAGYDVARGRAGFDTCSAEQTLFCES